MFRGLRDASEQPDDWSIGQVVDGGRMYRVGRFCLGLESPLVHVIFDRACKLECNRVDKDCIVGMVVCVLLILSTLYFYNGFRVLRQANKPNSRIEVGAPSVNRGDSL